MVRFFHRTASFDHPWLDVTSVFWGKFPNRYQPYIKAVDTFERELDSETGIMTVRRMITHHSPGPRWMYALGFPDEVSALEEITVDPHKRSFVMKTKNITAASIFQVAETCVYTENEELTTDYEQNIQITSFLPIFPSLAEDFSFNTCAKNSDKGVNTMTELCDNFKINGIQGVRCKMGKALKTLDAKYERVKENVKEKCKQYIDKPMCTLKAEVREFYYKADNWVDEVKEDAQEIWHRTDQKIDELLDKFKEELSDIISETDRKLDHLKMNDNARTVSVSDAQV